MRIQVIDWSPIPERWSTQYGYDYPAGAYVLRLMVVGDGRIWLGTSVLLNHERENAELVHAHEGNAWEYLLACVGDDLDHVA